MQHLLSNYADKSATKHKKGLGVPVSCKKCTVQYELLNLQGEDDVTEKQKRLNQTNYLIKK